MPFGFVSLGNNVGLAVHAQDPRRYQKPPLGFAVDLVLLGGFDFSIFDGNQQLNPGGDL